VSIIGTRRWREIRDHVLDRDGHRCRMLRDGAVCGAYADTVQHVNARRHGGGDELSNLVAACQPCNFGEPHTEIYPARVGPLSAMAVTIVRALDAAGLPTSAGRRRAIDVLDTAHPGQRFRSGDIDAACRWRRHRGPLGRL
jgi:hypothetical protein